MGPMGGPPPDMQRKMKLPPPKHLREVPGYLSKLIGGFFRRWLYIFRLVWETRHWILFFMFAMSVLSGVLPILSALVSKNLINALVAAAGGTLTGGFTVILSLLVLTFLCTFLTRMIASVSNFVTRLASELVTNHIRIQIMDKAKQLDLSSFDRPEFYEKLENANREAGHRPVQILNSTFHLVSNIISMVSFIVVLAAVSPWSSVIMILLSLPSAIVNFVYRRRNVLYMRRRSRDRREMDYFSGLLVNKDMVKEIRMLDLSDTLIQKFKAVFQRYFSGLRRLIFGEGAWDTGLTAVTAAVNCLLFLSIAYQVYDGVLTVGDYTLYTGALNSIASAVAALISTTAGIYEGTLFIDNMIAFMEEPIQLKTVAGALPAPITRNIGHSLRFEHVSFAYPGSTRNVLQDISFTLNAGETTVLVGLNGAGKTMLLKLLMRLYDPTGGTIYLDDRDIRTYDLREYYDLFGIVFQDFGKYALSVRENIAFGDIHRDATPDTIRDAAVSADADAFIDRLPDAYETPLTRLFEFNGVEPSIGQWQKLAVARAFYSRSDILILDEPTASLDAIAEQEIYSQFDRLRRGKTAIFVSHRLSSARMASRILVLQNGRVIENGTHEELMHLGGEYARLFTVQASRYLTENDEAGAAFPPPPNGAGRPPRS